MTKKISDLINSTATSHRACVSEIVTLLSLKNPHYLYEQADAVRARYMGNAVYLRGIVEFSNYCRKNCAYCGIRAGNRTVTRYRLDQQEIIDTCKRIEKAGQTTVVLQSGEDVFFTANILADLIKRIKQETRLAITLSVGERDEATYALWKAAGMDRFLLRFETSDRKLFSELHPDDDFDERIACLRTLQKLGVQTGSGFLIGLPYETLEQLAEDILFCTQLNLDMIGCGPFIVHPKTPLKNFKNPFDPEVFFKTIAILRLLNPKAHIPATTAFDAIDPNGRNRLLTAGANVFMPNATPSQYRKHYLLYPNKPCVDETPGDCAACVIMRIQALGREIGKGPGHSSQ